MPIARRTLVAMTTLAMLASGLAPAQPSSGTGEPGDGVVAGELATETLSPVTAVTPDSFGADDETGLAQPDPTEGLSLLEAPTANNTGSMELEYPILLPPGHGITPELSLGYSSAGGNGWLGLGWDVGVGEVVVDTAFGAPHFNRDKESESYLLDGDLLTPNARGSAWEDRTAGDRADYSRQVETSHDEIIRHRVGSGWPADYFWEVRSKDGGVRWYGGHPDSGGPAPAQAATFDESSVVRNAAGHIVEWKLSAQRDVGVNLIRYEYERVNYRFDGAHWVRVGACSEALCGEHTFLKRILYTDATSSVTDRNGPPYLVEFSRESELGTVDNVRRDPVVDASLGYVDVLVDRLARIEVRHGEAPATGSERNHDEVAARYSFTYREGRFGKSLLDKITQGVDDPHVHTLRWIDELTGTATAINGLAAATRQNTHPDVRDRQFLSATSDVSALGGGESNGGSGNIYIGFNPAAPMKTGSFGAGIELSGADSESLVEWIDLNGDNLPDKVFVDDDGDIRFRLNTNGPGGTGTWDLDPTVNLPSLSKDSNFGFQVSFEAYPLVAIGVGTGAGFSWTNSYFADVNADGLVDFVSGGRVLFNRLVDDIPTFDADSSATPVPLGASTLPPADSPELAEIIDNLEKHSPPVDTVRRFVAPYTGELRISAPVAFRVGTASTDGARVAIQHNGTELASAELTGGSTLAAFASPLSVPVSAGDRIYFRLGAIDDGVDDLVDWQPVVEYVAPAWPEFDANGTSQYRFSAAEDFTLAGRPGDFIAIPAAGTVLVAADVRTLAPLTDDITLVALQRRPDGTTTRTELGSVAHGSPAGEHPFTGSLQVAFHADPADPDVRNPEYVSVYVETDSQIDLADLEWDATLRLAPGAIDQSGDVVDLTDGEGNTIFEHRVRPHVELYPNSSATAGVRPVELGSGTNTYRFAVSTPTDAPDGVDSVTAVVTLKSATDLVAKAEVELGWDGAGQLTSPEFTLDVPDGSEDLWLDVTFRNPQFSRSGLTLDEFVQVSGDTETAVDGAVLRWSGQQGIFPLAHRGWAIAGYTSSEGRGAVAMVESAFEAPTGGSTPTDPQRSDLSLEDTETAEESYAFVAAFTDDGAGRWEGPRGESLWADATGAQASRLATDSLRFDTSATGTGRSAPTRLGISGPELNLSFGVAILGASAGLSPSWGVIDFEDLNGDGYPDQVAAGRVSYTDQRGNYLEGRGVDRTSVTNQDLTISVNGGLDTGMVDVVPNAKGNTNAVGGDSANKGQSASDSGPSYSLGLSGSGGYSWSSPNASAGDTTSDSTYADQIATLRSDFAAEPGAEIQRALADVNGDGLPDSVYTTGSGVFAFYNLGYGFTEHAVSLGGGGFESKESATAGAGLGFSLPYGEFGGGVNLLWNWDWSTYAWQDLNGDGIPDRLRKDGSDSVKVAFGTGSGLLSEVTYGDFPEQEGSQHIAFDTGIGIGGGASATGYIGPLCLVACYLVIGGGGGYNHSVSATNVSVGDVNGDGYADLLQSSNDDDLRVRLNQHGFTNLLGGVTNPLGGSFDVEYARAGNTTDHPDSVAVLARVDVRDGRSAPQVVDGISTTGHYASEFHYDGLRHDRAHRSSLGFATVSTVELDTTDGDTPLRTTVQRFHNSNVFEAGLLREVAILDEAGDGVRGSAVTWGARTVRGAGGPTGGDPSEPAELVPVGGLGTDLHSVPSRGWSVSVAPIATDEYWFDGDEHVFSSRTELVWDGRGNVLEERALGAPDDPYDDLTTALTYTDCRADEQSAFDCRTQAEPAQPFWSPSSCSTGVSLPVGVSVTGVDAATGAEVLLRERRAPKWLCDNAAPLEVEELVAPGVYATTNMTFNAYGDYELVMAPPDADGVRYTVRYTYDEDRHTDIALVEEFDVPAALAATVLAAGPDAATAGTSSSATFDPLSGRVASRTDANGAVRAFTYDEHGRILTVSSAGNPAAGPLLVSYEYHANAPAYAYAVAHHADALDGNPDPAATDAAGLDATGTIDTVVFADGLGRVRQTKRDARMLVGGQEVVGRQVGDGVAYDPLARPTITHGPTVDTVAAGVFSPGATAGARTTIEWTVYDALERVTEPGDRVTTYDYPWETFEDSPLLAWTVSTDPEGRVVAVGQDVRDVVRYQVDSAAPRPGQTAPDDLVTAYRVNGLGELVAVVDSAGNESSYTHDLAGRTTSVTTPDGGTVETTYDLAGHRRTTTNEAMREVGELTTYSYAFNRLVTVDRPGTVDDVAYTYGTDNADGRFTAGRVAEQTDRTRIVSNDYDAAGNLVSEASTMKRQNWSPDLSATEAARFTYTTRWSHDPLGRLVTVEYPDAKTLRYVPDGTSVAGLSDPSGLPGLLVSEDATGEVVTYGYDSGGLLRTLTGLEPGVEAVTEEIAPDPEGGQRLVEVPRRTEHSYTYLAERAYDEWLYPVREELGNGAVTTSTYDLETRWLTARDTTSPAGELQRLGYSYDAVGRPTQYVNDLPPANRAINGGRTQQSYTTDGFGRIVGASGTFTLKKDDEQRYSYGVTYTPQAPWSIVAKEQTDALFPTRGRSKVTEATTYSFTRQLGTQAGPLQVVDEEVRQAGEKRSKTYSSSYTANGEVASVLLTGGGKASRTNVWDREYTWTLDGMLTSAERGSELRTYAYDDAGVLRIKDGSLLSRDGDVLAQHGGGPETLFPNRWVTVRGQKIYKHVTDGTDTIATQMDADGQETTRLFMHRDVLGSTNIVSDAEGRGFQRHEYLPSGEQWIVDNKETIRTPFQYGDGYYEDTLDMILFGARWYDSQRELFLSPDPLLVDEPRALIDQPVLGAAYTFAGASPMANVDPSGLAFFSAHQRVAFRNQDRATLAAEIADSSSSNKGGDTGGRAAKQERRESAQLRAEKLLEANSLVSIDLAEGEVSFGLPYGPRLKKGIGKAESDPVAATTNGNAANASGGPDSGSASDSDGDATTPTVDTGSDADGAGSGTDGPAAAQPDPQPASVSGEGSVPRSDE